MKTSIRKVVKTFRELPDASLLAFGRNVTACMATAVTVFPNPMLPLADINNELDNFAGLLQTAASRDKIQVQLKNQSRLSLLLMLGQLANYVNAVTTDPALLVQSKVPAPIELEAPTRMVLSDGPNHGSLTLRFRRARGAFSYLYQYTTDALLPEDSWVSTAVTTTTYTFTGLTKCTIYYVRAIAVGRNQQLMNSIVVNRVSQ